MIPSSDYKRPHPAATSRPGKPLRRFFDLDKVSAGAWYSIHLLAASGERAALVSLVSVFAKSFTCVECRRHIRQYLSGRALPEGSPRDLFAWTVDFHRAATAHSGLAVEEFTDEFADELFQELTSLAAAEERAAAGGGCHGGGCRRATDRADHGHFVVDAVLAPRFVP